MDNKPSQTAPEATTAQPAAATSTDQNDIAKVLLDLLSKAASQAQTRPLSQETLDAIERYRGIARDLATSPLKLTSQTPIPIAKAGRSKP